MKGLLVKDLRLMLGQKKFFVMLFLIAAAMIIKLDNPDFIITYLTCVSASFVISTISYDEFDNGNAFLFTLPISRRGYVGEKYLFGLLAGGAGLLAGLILLAFYQAAAAPDFLEISQGKGIFLQAATSVVTIVIALTFMIPIQLKFGSDKGRIAIFSFFGIAIIIGMFAEKIMEVFHIDIAQGLKWLDDLNEGALCIIFLAAAAVLLTASFMISKKIMEKKEF